ncbi:MAG: TauD/TfdA family dioxygenase, partial [bacterium]
MQINSPYQPERQPNPSAGTLLRPLLNSDEPAYRRWRDSKLENYISDPNQCLVEIQNPVRLSSTEKHKLQSVVGKNNFVIYQYSPDRVGNADDYQLICKQLGLSQSVSNPESDIYNVTAIRNHASDSSDSAYRSRYIPYTSQALNWHTDGYYNTGQQIVRSFVLHCVQSAANGGTNELLDHEIAYILLRERDPELANALCDFNCFTIPGNVLQ